MKCLLLLSVLFCVPVVAQNSFRISDQQGNDVTNGVIYLADTNASSMQVVLSVKNIDTSTFNTTAGRLVLGQPAGAQNAFIWNQIQYLPSADSSIASEFIAPGDSLPFEGYYFPNGNAGQATINYCFWNRYDQSNYACVTVTYDNYLSTGFATPFYSTNISVQPNPAPYFVGVGWSGSEYHTVNLYSSDGKLVQSRDVRGESECMFDLREMPPGIYMISCADEVGNLYNSCFIH